MIGTSLGTLLVLFSSVETTFKGIALIVGGLAAFAQAVLLLGFSLEYLFLYWLFLQLYLKAPLQSWY